MHYYDTPQIKDRKLSCNFNPVNMKIPRRKFGASSKAVYFNFLIKNK